MDCSATSLRRVGGDVLKLGVGFPSGKWQIQWRRGLVFGFQFRFGLCCVIALCWYRVRAIVLRLIALLWYLVWCLGICVRG